jgi:hypothetical protein
MILMNHDSRQNMACLLTNIAIYKILAVIIVNLPGKLVSREQ